MSSVGAVLTGISIACIAAGVLLLVAQVRRRPADPVPSPSANGSEPPGHDAPRPAPPVRDRAGAAASRGESARRRRILAALLMGMVASLAAALVVQERWLWGVHLFLDDAFLGYVAWLARRAETRARAVAPNSDALAPTPVPVAAEEERAVARGSAASSEEIEKAEEAEEAEEAEVTDARG